LGGHLKRVKEFWALIQQFVNTLGNRHQVMVKPTPPPTGKAFRVLDRIDGTTKRTSLKVLHRDAPCSFA
jgi:hypothetical protein